MNFFKLNRRITCLAASAGLFALSETMPLNAAEQETALELAEQPLPPITTLEGPSTTVRVLEKIVMYLPNRILDVFDCVTIEYDAGPRFGVNLIMTRACQLGVIGGRYYGLGWDWQRRIGSFAESGYSARWFFYGQDEAFRRGTTGGMEPFFLLEDGTPDPHNEIYTSGVRDYYAIGVEAACLSGAVVQFHPRGVWDFLCGFVFLDPDDDDPKFRYAFPAPYFGPNTVSH